jgi:hypothetical protein
MFIIPAATVLGIQQAAGNISVIDQTINIVFQLMQTTFSAAVTE